MKRVCLFIRSGFWCAMVTGMFASAADAPSLPPMPPPPPRRSPPTAAPLRGPKVIPPSVQSGAASGASTALPNAAGRVVPAAVPQASVTVTNASGGVPLLSRNVSLQLVPATILAWDNDTKEAKAKPGDASVELSFSVTNVSSEEVLINWVRTSCGCTVAQMPSQPWKLGPGEGGLLPFKVDIRGKSGLLTKVASVETSKGFKSLTLKVDVPSAPAGPMTADSRMRNAQIAAADRQAVFRGDCATCHVAPGRNLSGEPLYAAVCGVCHEAEHRATMVPDLKTLQTAADENYWRAWITTGKPGTLMPAFAQAQGGPLNVDQVESLVTALLKKFPRPGGASTAASASGPTAAASSRAAAPATN